MNPSPSISPRRHFLRSLLGGGLFFGLVAWNLIHALRARRDALAFTIDAPHSDPFHLYTTELLDVDWQRQIWYWPRKYLERYWSDPLFFPAGAQFTAELHGRTILRGRVTHALDAARVSQPTLRVLQMRTGPGPGPLLAGDLGFAFALSDDSPS